MQATDSVVATPVLAATATMLPAVMFAVIMVFARSRQRLSAGLSIFAAALSASAGVVLLVRHWHLAEPLQYAATWMRAGQITILFGFLLDPVSLLMLTVVAWICLIVQVYSLGYMAGDPGFGRYYAFMSLFASAMMLLTVSPTLLQLYIFWELVGLSSYLLIGFWYEKFSASEAGKKAFVMTRLGDVAFFLGLLLLLTQFGNLTIADINGPALPAQLSPGVITAAALLIFGGIVGKSAQFPLLTWLPDAMEGPTPVSALLHSATMVAAGVYLFARLFPFFSLSPTAMTVFLLIGTISMIAASTMAMVSRDIKRVWAFSTISQLGYMIMALAAGGYFAGIFHLTTHAVFKALLFLCAGVLIHHFDTNDMFEIGRNGGRRLKITMTCMVIGGAALSGLPPLSGFFSKEAIIGTLVGVQPPIWMVVSLTAGLAGVFLTAYYTFRLIFIILFPQTMVDAQPFGHHHGSRLADNVMVVPLMVLAGLSLVLGACMAPLARFIGPAGGAATEAAHHTELMAGSLALALAGVGLAWIEFGRRGAARKGFIERWPAVCTFFEERWYLDRFYRFALDTFVYKGIAQLCQHNDQKVIDGGIDVMSRATAKTGSLVSRLHVAMIQYRLLVIFVMVAVAAAVVIL